nr:hypothetical protein [uncultured Treponema sp.]
MYDSDQCNDIPCFGALDTFDDTHPRKHDGTAISASRGKVEQIGTPLGI